MDTRESITHFFRTATKETHKPTNKKPFENVCHRVVDEYAGRNAPMKTDRGLFVPGFVGIAKRKVFWPFVESSSFRCYGKLDMIRCFSTNCVCVCRLCFSVSCILRLWCIHNFFTVTLVTQNTTCTIDSVGCLVRAPFSAVWKRIQVFHVLTPDCPARQRRLAIESIA